MMDKKTVKRISRQVNHLREGKDRLVIDADTHPTNIDLLSGDILRKYKSTPNYYHGRPISMDELLAEMDMAGVDMALSWQNPAAFKYTTDLAMNFDLLYRANLYVSESAYAYPTRIIPAGWTDPRGLGLEKAIEMAQICVKELGCCIVKLNPAQNAYPIDSDEVFTIVDHIIDLGAVPAFHYGGDTPYTSPEGLIKLAQTYSDSKIMAVHMGGGGSSYTAGESVYLKTRELGLSYPNIVFPISAKRDTHIESDLITYQLAGTPFCNHLFCGSDAPYGRLSWNWGGYDFMFRSLMDHERHPDVRIQKNPGLFNPEVIQNYKGRNLAIFLLEAYQNLLIRQQTVEMKGE